MDTIVISKPKKNENSTYVANVYKNGQKEKLSLDISYAVPLYMKEMSEGSYVFIKCVTSNNLFYDLNEAVIENVKMNCGKWFNHSIEPSLIEEYYSNTLVYDKKHGIILRLKCATPESGERIMQYAQKLCDISLHVTSLRFFKQKYILEWYFNDITVTKTEHVDNDISELEDDDCNEDELEVPMPSHEELVQMKTEYLDVCKATKKALEQRISETEKKLSDFRNHLSDICSVYSKLKESDVNYKDILGLCEKVDDLMNLS